MPSCTAAACTSPCAATTPRRAQLAQQLPSRNSRDYGRSFADIFKAVEYDFYKIDPALFAPAEVWVSNLDSGNTWHGGALNMACCSGCGCRRLIAMRRVAIMTDESAGTRASCRPRCASAAPSDAASISPIAASTPRLSWHGLVMPGFGRELPDAVLVRGIAGGSFEQVTKRLGVLHALRELGVPVYNDARAIERSVDKSMTSLLLHAARVPTPPTWATESQAEAQRIVMRESAAGHALVLKPLFGSQGKGLQRVGLVDGVHQPLPALARVSARWRTCSASSSRSARRASTGACW